MRECHAHAHYVHRSRADFLRLRFRSVAFVAGLVPGLMRRSPTPQKVSSTGSSAGSSGSNSPDVGPDGPLTYAGRSLCWLFVEARLCV